MTIGPGAKRIPGGFILITGMDGICYAVRPQSNRHPCTRPTNDEMTPLFS